MIWSWFINSFLHHPTSNNSINRHRPHLSLMLFTTSEPCTRVASGSGPVGPVGRSPGCQLVVFKPSIVNIFVYTSQYMSYIYIYILICVAIFRFFVCCGRYILMYVSVLGLFVTITAAPIHLPLMLSAIVRGLQPLLPACRCMCEQVGNANTSWFGVQLT